MFFVSILALSVCSADTSPQVRGFGIPRRFPANANRFHRTRNLFAKGSHFGGAGAPAPERASPVKLLQRRCDTMALTSRVRIAVCLALWQHPCPLRLLRRHLSQSERLWHPATFPEIPETDKIPETPANSTGTVILIYPTCVCFARVSRHKFVTFCWWSAQTFGGIYWAISTRNG